MENKTGNQRILVSDNYNLLLAYGAQEFGKNVDLLVVIGGGFDIFDDEAEQFEVELLTMLYHLDEGG